MPFNPVFTTVTRINLPHQEGYGTGFFYNSDGESFLITNRHVIHGEEAVASIRIFTRDFPNHSDIEWLDISLEQGNGEDWYEHPLTSESEANIDIVAIPIDETLSPFSEYINTSDPDIETGSTAFTSEMIMSGDELLAGGDMAMIIGYPAEFVDTNTYYPILRNARIASPLGLPFQDRPIFITDALMYEGTSGSPVVAGPETLKNPTTGGLRTSSQGFALLGVHSETYKRPTEVGVERLNLNAAWYADLIDEILEQAN